METRYDSTIEWPDFFDMLNLDDKRLSSRSKLTQCSRKFALARSNRTVQFTVDSYIYLFVQKTGNMLGKGSLYSHFLFCCLALFEFRRKNLWCKIESFNFGLVVYAMPFWFIFALVIKLQDKGKIVRDWYAQFHSKSRWKKANLEHRKQVGCFILLINVNVKRTNDLIFS